MLASSAFHYYVELEAVWAFYRGLLGFETLEDYGFAKTMHAAAGSLITDHDFDLQKFIPSLAGLKPLSSRQTRETVWSAAP